VVQDMRRELDGFHLGPAGEAISQSRSDGADGVSTAERDVITITITEHACACALIV
jgi:hypothetical protein